MKNFHAKAFMEYNKQEVKVHAKWACYSPDYKPILQQQAPCILLPNVSSDLTTHAGWLNHQDQGLCCIFSLVKSIQKLKYFFHLLCSSILMVQDMLQWGRIKSQECNQLW